MIRLIRAELYRAVNRAYLYIFLACIIILIISGVGMLNIIIRPHTAYTMINLYLQFLIMPVYLALAFVDVTAGDEVKENTLKNTVSSGIPRYKIYLSKIISSAILEIISGAIILIILLSITFILFEPGPELTGSFLLNIALRIMSAIPLYIAATAAGILLCFIIKRNSVVAAVYIILFTFPRTIFDMLGYVVSDKFHYIYRAFITTNIGVLAGQIVTYGQMMRSIATGFLYIIIFTAAGIEIFRRQEI